MSTNLPRILFFVTILSSCVASSHNRNPVAAGSTRFADHTEAVATTFEDVDTAFIMPHALPENQTPDSLTNLPRTENGAFVLAPGLYEAEFKTYCLQPGTPAPSAGDAYFQAPLSGTRKDIVATILRNSQKEAHLDQKNVQLLLWSVVSQSDFSKVSPAVRTTAVQLLSPRQLFELNGGMVGVVKAVAKALPASARQSKLQQLFELGVSSYDAYERLAVLNSPAQISRPGFQRDQWYRHRDGYYVRYFPKGYQRTKVQVYMPQSALQQAARDTGYHIVFDPVSTAVVPANSNAQRLGIGAPVRDIVRSVIRVIGSGKGSTPPKEPKGSTPPKEPKGGTKPN